MIAIPITAKSVDEALDDIKQANRLADIIELRLDLLEQLNETILQELIQECSRPVIATNRKKTEPEEFGQIERFFLLRKAIDFGAAFIDLELETDKRFIGNILNYKNQASLIVSHHDFAGTPPRETLESILKKQISTGADIVKIATLARSQKDNETVLGLIPIARNFGKPMIAFCMGEAGKQSRIDCLAKGSFLTYACLEKGKESALGQLTIKEMRKALRLD